MRGNSGLLRWEALFVIILGIFAASINGGPARHRRMMREVYNLPEAFAYPNISQLSENEINCSYDGKEVLKSSISCNLISGCKKIETRGECCPKYQCDCKRDDGVILKNGEKLFNPENACNVCVCQGGELNCNNQITCYNRNDCKTIKYIPGRCCPEYDNCPPLENVQLGLSKENNSTEDRSIYFKSSTTTTSEVPVKKVDDLTSTVKPVEQPEKPMGIKIKEITKPEEIRITDNKPKNFMPPKSTESIKSTAMFLELVPASSEEISEEHEASGSAENVVDTLEEKEHNTNMASPNKLNELDNNTDENSVHSDAMDTTENFNINGENASTTPTYNDSLELKTVNPIAASDLSSEYASSTTEKPFEHDESENTNRNTSVLQIGNNVLILNQSGKTQSITLDVSGLQRGEDEDDERKNSRKTDSDDMQYSSTVSSSTDYYAPSTSSMDDEFDIFSSSSDLPLITGAVHETVFYSTIGPDVVSSEIFDVTQSNITKRSNSSSTVDFYDNNSSTVNPIEEIDTSDIASGYAPIKFETVYYPPSYDSMEGSSSTSDEHNFEHADTTSNPTLTQHFREEDDADFNENIEYPSQPPDVSIHGSNMDADDHESKLQSNMKKIKEETIMSSENKFKETELKILTDVIPLRSNDSKTEMLPSSTLMPEEWLKLNTSVMKISAKNSEVTQQNGSPLKLVDAQERTPGEPLLIPEWERVSTTIDPTKLMDISSSSTSEELSSNFVSTESFDSISSTASYNYVSGEAGSSQYDVYEDASGAKPTFNQHVEEDVKKNYNILMNKVYNSFGFFGQ